MRISVQKCFVNIVYQLHISGILWPPSRMNITQGMLQKIYETKHRCKTLIFNNIWFKIDTKIRNMNNIFVIN
jgi:hypothetical protein